ncbi:Beta-ketoacyl synthase N-terminal domain family protein [Acanthocheilonema viteae]
MASKYDLQSMPDIVNIANEWNNCCKIVWQQNGCKGEENSKVAKGQLCNKGNNEQEEGKSERLDIRREQRNRNYDGSNKNKERLGFENNVDTGNAIIQNQKFRNNKELERIEAFKIPGLLISIQRKDALTLSSFQILSDTFQQYYTHCCNVFHICPTTETLEQSAAVTYAIVRLLFHIGYNPGRAAVSGLDALMLLAAKDALKLEDACFAWKTIAPLMKDRDSPKTAQRINAILLKFDINFQKEISIINVDRLTISDTESLTAAILTNDEQNQLFLASQMESYMIFGSWNDCLMKHIENFDDFIIFQKDFKILLALKKVLIRRKSISNFLLKSQFYQSEKSSNQNFTEILSVQMNLKEKKYLFAHLVHNCNILSAATLLTTIYSALSNQRNILQDITFLFPVTFASESKSINFKVQISSEICTVTYLNYQCVTFRLSELCPGMHSGSSNNRKCQFICHGISRSEHNAKSVTEEEFYTEMEKYHYQYNEEFRCVRKLVINENNGTVQLGPSTHLDALIDGAMQAIVFIYIQQYGTKLITLVPFHIWKIEIVRITEQTILVGKYENANILAFVKAELKNGKLLGSFEFATNEIAVAAHAISFYPITSDNIMKVVKRERALSSNSFEPRINSRAETSLKPEVEESMNKNELSQMTLNQLNHTQDKRLICIKSIACRLPKIVHDPAEFWDALKTGQIMASKIPCSRISGRDNLAEGLYGHSIRCANFLADDISYFDATFFGISRSEAEKMDPQQRILLECVYECMENAGLTSLRDAGFFVGFMSNEYPDIVKSQDAISMLGSSASVVSGRLNYLFGSAGPAITLDTACSSSLVALQAAIHALLDGHCSIAVVAGVNLILTEQSIGQRANGNLLADDGMCRSFDARSSGYGRADGCVALLLSIADKAVEGNDCAASIISTCIGHNGQSMSLTSPNGCAQEKLLRDCLSKIQGNQSVNYWETHGTGTIIGDSIELKALQANLQHCLISTAKTHFGHSEAAAGAAGLAKILLQFKYEYIPEHGSYEFLQNLRDGTLYLPVIGEEWMEDAIAGTSSFGISGTNAMTILKSEKGIFKRSKKRMTTEWQMCICPISAKSKESLDMLTRSYQTVLKNTSQNMKDICSAAALYRNHLQCRAVILLRKGKIMQKWINCEKSEKQEMIGLKLYTNSYPYIIRWFYSNFAKFRTNFKIYLPLMKNFVTQKISTKFQRTQSAIILTGFLSLITFLHDLGIKIRAIHACDNLSLTAALLITGKLKFINVNDTVYSNIQIYTQKISTANTYTDNYKWYKLYTIKDEKTFEYELMEMIATSYLQGDCINWTCLYTLPLYPTTLPNYQFKRESYWIAENSATIDHWLIGRLMKDEENECIFINQISKMTNGELMAIEYDGQMRFSFGICCEAIIQALQLTFFKNITDQSRSYFFRDITMVKYRVQENDWIKTTIIKYTDEKYHVKLTCVSNVICEANIILIAYTIPMKALNVTQIGNFITKPNFYETLNDKGIFYKKFYQIITRASSNEKIFVAKCRCQIFLLMEAIIQAACYLDLLNPYNVYGEKKFTIENLNFHTLLSESMCVWIENREIIAYNRSNNKMMISASLNYKKVNEKLGKTKCQKKKNQMKPNQFINFSFTTYQKCADKVRQAVEDIRKGDNPISNKQLSVSFTELGLDSLSITDLANRLNTIYFPNLQIGAVDLFNYPNIFSLTDAIYNHKISSRIIDNEEEKIRQMIDKHSDIITTLDKSTRRRSQSQHVYSSLTIDENESCAYTQTFFKVQSRNDCTTLIITDKQFISGKKLNNQLVIIVSNEKKKCRSTEDDIGILYLNTRDPRNFKRHFLSHFNDHKTAIIRFELIHNFPLRYLAEVLLHLTEVIIQSKSTYIFSSKPGCGGANAFALGFAKSLSAELYPKVQYEWNFILQKASSLTKYMEELPRSLQTDDDNCKERWLITGGLGGIGWQMAKFIAYNRKVSHLFLLGRKQPNKTQIEEMNKMRDSVGIDVRAVSVDLRSKMQMKEFFEKLQISLTSIIHSAGCIHDALASKQSISTFRLVTEAKCVGLLILEKLCRSHPIKHFIVNSSISSIIGNIGQCNYSAANAFIDEIMTERRAKGLPATTINWGNWLEIGMAVNANKILNKMGFIGLKTRKAMNYLQTAIDYVPARMIIIELNVRKILHYRPDLALVFPINENNILKSRKNAEQALSQSLQLYVDRSTSVAPKQCSKNMKQNDEICENDTSRVKSIIVKILEEITEEAVTDEDYQKSFMNLGLDSLKIYRFVSELTKRIEIKPTLNVLAIFEHPTIDQLSRYIRSLFCRIRERSEVVTNGDNFLSKHKENIENIAKNFTFFVFHSKNEKKLEKEKFHFFDSFEQSPHPSEISSDRSFEYDQSNGYCHVVWGSKYKILRNSLLHFEIIPNIKQSKKPVISFMVSGQGSQIWNMGRQLSCIFPFFRKKFDETLDVATRYMPEKCVHIRDVIYQWRYRELLYKTEYAQPIIYCFAYSLAKFYEFCGVQANFFVGHSIGEAVACTLAGRISFDDGLRLVIRRGEILGFTRGKGKMIAVRENDAKKLQQYSGMSRAAENSHKQIILSGDNRSARLCLHFARLYQCPVTVIDDCYPFHSSAINDTLLDQYRMECRKVKLEKTKVRNVVSNCTGKFMEHKTESIASIKSAVFFKRCVETLNDNNTNIWLEIGNGEILTTLVKSMLGSKPDTLICSGIKNDKQEVDSFMHSLCQLQLFGVKIKWERICNRTNDNNVQKMMKSCMKKRKTERRMIIGKKSDMEMIEQHLMHGKIILPAAFIIAKFVEFTRNSLKTCIGESKNQKCKTILFQSLRLEKRVNEIDLNKLEIKFDSSELILTDNISKYSTCRLGNEERKKILEQMKQINALNTLRMKYEQLKITMDELPHQAFYETMRRRGLQYGLKYQILREIYYKDCYIGATLININGLTQLVDGALQLLSAALLTKSKLSIYIPFSIDDIIIKYDEKTAHNYFHAYGIISKRIDNIIKGSVVIYEDNNQVIALNNAIAIDVSSNKSSIAIKHRNPSDSQYSSNIETKHSSIEDKSDKMKHVEINSNNADNSDNTTGIKKDKKLSVRNETLQIEIVSYAGQFPGSAVDCASLWNNLKTGTSSHISGNIQKLQTDITMFNPVHFGITPKEATYIDPQQRILLEMTQKTIENAGLERLDSETGVFIGISSSDFAQKAYAEIEDICSYLSTGTNQSVLAGRIAYWFNLKGPTMVIDTACSSFFSALVVACDNIRMGNCRAALVGTVNIILNLKPTSVLQKAQMLSKTGSCKVFDVDADGYVRSEGAAVILIRGVSERNYNSGNEILALHRNDMMFTIESYSMGHNGRSNGLTIPNGISEYELINTVNTKRVNTSTISWVEAHATGTPLGDPIETEAIVRAVADLSNRPIYITSVKSSIGHCEAAGGAASLIMALEAYRHHYLPPIQHFKLLNTNITNNVILNVPVIGEELPGTFDMLINSFGFSGTNVSVILRGWNRRELEENEQTINHLVTTQRLSSGHFPCILLCSANDSESFKLESEKLEEFVKETSHSLVTICACLQNLRSTGKHRTAIPIKRHTQKRISFRTTNKQQKWSKIVLSLGKSPEPCMIAELYTVYPSFQKIFIDHIKTYKCANNFTSTKRSGKFAFEYVSKLSLITFLITIGINPSTIIASSKIDRIVIEVLRGKYKMKYASEAINTSDKGMPYQHYNFEIRKERVFEDFDCILNMQTLLIEQSGMIYSDNWKRSFTNQFVDTICQLYEHFVDINWQVLNNRTTETCLIPDSEYCKEKYWPFTDRNVRSIDYSNHSYAKVPFSNLQPEISQTAENLKADCAVDSLNNNNVDSTEMDSVNHHYLYRLVQKKCTLPKPRRIIPFIAINLTDPTTIIAQQAMFVDEINDDDDIFRIKKQLDLYRCTKLVLEWIIDEENLLENTIRQSITNMKLCLIVFATVNIKGKQRLFAPFSALLKTLAMEQTNVNFKSIHTDIIDQQLFDEISDENFLNEIIWYNSGSRYVERLQQVDDNTGLVLEQTRNAGRILITGNIRGIAIELIKLLKPDLAVVVSRSMPSTCNTGDNGSVIRTIQADCTNYKQMNEIFATFAPFDIVFHCAATISNGLMENMNVKLFEMVCYPKVIGLHNIIRLSEVYPIRKIAAFSSAATIFGSAGQANYVVANELMEYLMRRDMPDGLFISWGPWDGRGLLAGKHMAAIRKQIQNSSWKLMQVEKVAQLCCKLLSSTGHHIVMDVNFDVLRKKRPYLSSFLECIPDNNIHKNGDLHSDSKSEKNFNEIIKNCITEVSGITDVRPDVGFMSMGIDSLMISEMIALLKERFNLNIPVAIFYEYSTVETLSQYLSQSTSSSCKLKNDMKEKDTTDEVAIIGYSGAFSGASDDETFWHSLLNGKELIEHHKKTTTGNCEITEAIGIVPDIDKFDYRFWKMSPDDASYIDPQIRKFIEHAYVALERSGLIRLKSKLRIAVVAGAEPSEYRPKSRRIGGIENLYEMNQKDFVAAWTSHLLDLHGPSFGVYSACSTALVAIIQALNLLHKNQCDVALAGAVSLAMPRTDDSRSLQGMVLSTDGHCRPFDYKSSGTVRGSAVGVVVLGRLSEARQTNTPVIARIAGYGITNDGLLKSSFMAPNINGQLNCMKEAIEMAGTSDVDYIECHGTGTTTGDLIELTAMSRLYHRDTLIGSVKANIGHALAGAGIGAIIKLCKIAEMKIIPKQINFDKLNENLKDVSFKITQCNIGFQKKKLRLAMNSCGIGGTNAHIIIENDDHISSINHSNIKQCFYALTISGRTGNACIHLCNRIANYLTPETNLAQVASTLQNYREHFEYRIGINVQSAVDAINQLKNIGKMEKMIKLKRENIAFYFAPQGLEYSNMGLEAMAYNEVFRGVMQKCCHIASKLTGINFQTIIHPQQKFNSQYAIIEQPYSQMATFIVCFALAEQLLAWGIKGCIMMGHSLGEYVAAAQADVFDVETALKILFKRGCLIAKTEKAKMLAVKHSQFPFELPIKSTDEKSLKIAETVEVSAILRSDLKCLVGNPERIDELKKKLEEDEVHCRELETNYGFHSSFMDSILEEFEQFLENFTFREPTTQILSNIDGQVIKHFDSKYMVKHMRSTIRIDKCIENLDSEIKIIIEIGPKGILESLLKDNPREIGVISTLPSKKQYEKGHDTGDLIGVATKLWMKGYELNWEMICGNYGFDKLLPNYQFEKDICWEYQEKKWNTEKSDVNLYGPCWIPYKFTNRRRFPKGVLLFLPTIRTKAICTLLTVLHNLFVPVQCIFSDSFSTRNVNVINGDIYINSNKEESYQQLANFLRDSNFCYDTIIHAWNLSMNYETEQINDSYLLSSFYSINWILTNLIQNITDIRFLVSIDWNAEPEIFTILGPIRELTMTRQSSKAACILCTPKINLFEALQLLESYQADFSLIRNTINGEFEYFSYQVKQIESSNYIAKNWDQSIDKNECVIRNADVIVIFGFGSIGQSFIDVLCQNFDFLTICIASPNATHHFQKLHTKINQWKSSRKFRTSGKINITNNQHTILAYDVDVRKKEQVQHFLSQIMLQHGRINIIIHAAAGKIDSTKFEKNFDQIQFVLQPKIRGVRNIISILCEDDISIRSLILNSSMNALFGLPGNNDYAASNIFLDACCNRNYRSIQNITTIQWTGWRDSNMLEFYANKENKSQNPVANFIIEYSLSMNEAKRMIWKCLHEQGLIAVSFVRPNDIVHEIRKLNFTVSDKFVAIPEQEKSIGKNGNDLRNIIAKIWMNYLGVERVTSHDDFFQLGGHSLNGMQIIWEINRVLQTDCKLDDLFQNSQFENFSQLLQKTDINEKDRKFPYNLKSYKILDDIGELRRIPLSYPQENMYILRQLQHPTLYNISFLLIFQGLFCIKSLRKALLFLIARQTSLRTTFSVSNNGYCQEIQSLTESYYHITWPVVNEFERRKLIKNEKNHIMDLSKIPFRILAMCSDESEGKGNEYILLISQHHIITDGWSMTIFANELGQFYRYCVTNQRIPETLKRLSRNVTHFAIWQRSNEFTARMQNDLQRLCAKLQGLQATRIVAQKTAIMASKLISQKTFEIPPSLWAQIIRTAKQYQQTIYTVMLTAFLCLVRKFSDDYSNNTIVIGCPVSGRVDTEEMKSVIGYFLNNIILIVRDFKMNATNSILFEQVKEAIQEARSFEHLPFHLLVAKLSHHRRHIQQHPIFDIFFNYRHNLDFPKIEISDVRSTITQLTTNDAFDFACTIDEIEEGTLITIDYNVNQYSIQLIDEMIAVYFKLLKSISSNQSDSGRNVMNDLECKTYQDVLSGSVIDIIEQQSVLTDKLTAFCYPHQTITYRQMYGMIHMFSKKIKQFYLQNTCESIRADTIIPICADSNAIIVPLLAVQLAGAAYAPIDPANSTTMIMQLVQDIGASIIIVQRNDLGLNIPALSLIHFLSLDCHQQSCIYDIEGWLMDHLNEKFKRASSRKRLQSCDASYIIFTSGSTGKPKAVCVTNQNLLSFVLTSTQQATFYPKFRIYHSVNTIFDVSCVNIFTTFSNGCCLIASQNILNAIVEIVQRNVKFAFLPSAFFNMLDEDEIVQLQQLEKLYVGGETPNNQQLNRCMQMGIRICQIYGPTETTVWSLSNNCSILEYECGRVIGSPINNETAYLLDSANNITCNGGKGRKDKQLKICGYRVEPGEIETAIKRWDSSIRNVAVLKNDQLDSLFLFIEKDIDSRYRERLREHLKQHLLHFMIPKKIIMLQRMPLNKNGKIDINKLNEMMENSYSAENDSTISKLCQFDKIFSEQVREIWCQLLGISNPKLEDDFFVIGGHSLLLVLLRQKLRDKFKFDLNFEHFYRQPTLAALIDSIHTNMNVYNGVTDEKKISNYHVCRDQMSLYSSLPTYSIPIIESVRFVNLRETTSAIGNLYMVHAIAGTIYPYFGLLSTIPQCLNIYAIEYEFHYPSNSLMELASFYSKQIIKHSQMKAIHLMGHSLGGILAREIAQLLNDNRDNEVTFVIMLDSWYIGIDNLHVNNVKCYLQEKLEGLPGKEEYIKKSAKLTAILQNHQFSINSIKIYLLKAKNHGNSPLRADLRGSNPEQQTRSLISNGWQKISAKNVDIFLADGDHDSMLHQHNIIFLSNIFAYIYGKNGVMVEQA